MPKENGYFQYCLELVARKANNLPVSEWTDGNYILLSEEIFAESEFRIHRNTLKMFYGKSIIKTSEPQADMKEAFARYLGFEKWGDFRNSAELESLTGPQYVASGSAFPFLTTPIPNIEDIIEEEISDKKPNYRWLIGFFMLLIILSAFFYWKSKHGLQTFNRIQNNWKVGFASDSTKMD